MAEQIKNLKGLFTDVKTRTIILFTGALLFIGIIVGILGFSSKPKATEGQGGSNAAAVPSVATTAGITNAPSVQYAKAIQLSNEKAAEQAKAAGTSSIPTLIGQTIGNNKVPPPPKVQPQVNLPPTLPSSGAYTAPGGGQAVEKKRQAVQKQVTDILGAWSKSPTQQFVQGNYDTNNAAATPGSNANAYAAAANSAVGSPAGGGVNSNNVPPLAKAGDIFFAVLDTAIDSDQPGPVLATLVSGDFAGAKIMGDLKMAPDGNSVIISFSHISLPDAPRSYTINAVAIDPDTARTALASNVDHHYLMRYGTLFASAFLSGYAQAVGRQGQTTTTSAFGSQTTAYAPLTPHQEVIMAFGQVGTQLGQQLGQLINTPPTVTVNAGTSVGVLLTDDLRAR